MIQSLLATALLALGALAGPVDIVNRQMGPGCAVIFCPGDTICIEVNGRGRCVPPACATVKCIVGTYCVVVGGLPKCIASPTRDCEVVLCPADTECKVIDSQPQCIPLGQKCGWNTCSSSEFCCNESCGYCAPLDPLGGGCTEEFCLPIECGPTKCAGGQQCCSTQCGTCRPKGTLCPMPLC
jgi:hypothetical protein